MPGARCTRGPVCACAKQELHTSIQVKRRQSGIPCASGLTAYTALSLVTGLSCHHHQRDAKHHRQLSASVGAPGPHGFAVRECAVRLSAPPRLPHPASNVRDDRETPLFSEAGRSERYTNCEFCKPEFS